MKHFKILALLLSFTALALVSSCNKDEKVKEVINVSKLNSEIRGGGVGSSCLERNLPLNTGSCTNGIYTSVITLDDYPGCLFYVKMEYWLCTSFSNHSLWLGDFEVYDYLCPAFEADLTAAENAGVNALNDFSANFNNAVWNKLIGVMVTNLAPVGASVITVKSFQYACTKTCYVPSQISHEGHNALIPVKSPCTSDCCFVQVTYNKQINGTWVQQGNPTYDYPEEQCASPSNPTCPENAEFETECYGGCPIIE